MQKFNYMDLYNWAHIVFNICASYKLKSILQINSIKICFY